jgi:autotransporter-associated beta strand protein
MLMIGGLITGNGNLIIEDNLDIRAGQILNFEVGGDIYKRGYGRALVAPFDPNGDYDIFIERGKLAYSYGGLGSTAGNVFVTSAEFARLEAGSPAGGVGDDVHLNNGRGFSSTGALVSTGSGGRVSGNIYLGDIGAVIGLLPGTSFSENLDLGSRIHGGSLDIAGRGVIAISGGDHTYTGATRVGMNGDVTSFILGDSGRLPTTSAIEIGGNARLHFNQHQTGVDRIANEIPVTLHGGSLEARGVQLGPLPSPPSPVLAERMGVLTLARGGSNVSIDFEVAALDFARLHRDGTATINFGNQTGSGNPSPYLRIGFDEAPTLTNSIIGGWATVNSLDFATYDELAGVKELGNTVPRPSQVENASPSSHVRVDFGANLVPLTKDTTISTLAITTEGGRNLNLGGHTLTLREGGFIRSGSATVNMQVQNGRLTAGDGRGPGTLYLHAKWQPVYPRPEGVSISADIIDNPAGGTVSVVKSGNFEVTLSGNNTYSGPTIIQDSTLVFASEDALPSGSNLVLESGAARLDYTPAGVKSLNRLVLAQGGHVSAPINTTGGLPQKSDILLDASEYLVESGNFTISLVGDGMMRKFTDGLAELSNDSPDYTGAIIIEQGALVAGSRSVVRAPQALGQGETEIRNGGTLIHGSADPGGYMRLDAELHLAGGNIGIWRSITTSRWDFEGSWRVTKPSRLLTLDPLGIDEFDASINVQANVEIRDGGGLSMLGNGSVNLLGGVAVDGDAVISTEESAVSISAINSAPGGGSLRLDGGRFILPQALNNDVGVGDLSLEIGPSAVASVTGSGPLVIDDGETLIVNGTLTNAVSVQLVGGSLQGVGVLSQVSNLLGELAPGNSLGVMTVGNYTQGAGGTLTMEIFGDPGQLSDQLRTEISTLSGELQAVVGPGGDVTPGDVFTLIVARQLRIDDLRLNTSGFSGELHVVTLQDGPDAGMQALQLNVVPEPASRTLLIMTFAVLLRCEICRAKR